MLSKIEIVNKTVITEPNTLFKIMVLMITAFILSGIIIWLIDNCYMICAILEIIVTISLGVIICDTLIDIAPQVSTGKYEYEAIITDVDTLDEIFVNYDYIGRTDDGHFIFRDVL